VDVAGWMTDVLSFFPDWFVVIIISMMPFVELRLALPLAIGFYDMNPVWAFFICVTANMVPVPFILVFFKHVEKWFRRYPYWDKYLDKIFTKTRTRAGHRIKKYQAIGLIVYVGIPLPVTGAWTGSLIAYLFDLDIKNSFFYIFIGVIIAGVIMLALILGLLSIF
jgi:uncharacterized membrane protein